MNTILSFDLEEHFRIEAAVDHACSRREMFDYSRRMERTTYDLLDRLSSVDALATFFIVGEIAESHPALIQAIASRGHEIASHGWDHQRLHRMTPASFRQDIRQSRDVLEQVSGQRVWGYRAPTFSLVRETAWAIDVLSESGLAYDSSIFPVRHDRYGVPKAPRTPFLATNGYSEILEIPPVTLRICGMNFPVAGGGYFRLFPLSLMHAGLRQLEQYTSPAVGMLYFHPWEFDPEQPRLRLPLMKRWRTYVGMSRTMDRLESLLREYKFRRAVDIAFELKEQSIPLPNFSLDEINPATIPLESTIKSLSSEF